MIGRLNIILSKRAYKAPKVKITFQVRRYQELIAIWVAFILNQSANALLEVRKSNKPMIKKEYLRNIIKNIGLIILCRMILTTLPANAKDFGTKGHTYQIIEQPFLRMIDERLQKVDMKKEQEKMTAIVKDRALNPRAVEGLLPATKSRVFYFDPTYTLEEDAVLPCGKILHKAGTKVNPLEHMDLNRRLFFIDSRELSYKMLYGFAASAIIFVVLKMFKTRENLNHNLK